MELNLLILKPQCINTYKEVSEYLEDRLYKVLEDIERFYYSDFWEKRFKRRLREEGLDYNLIELDRILGTTTSLKDDNIFKLFDKSIDSKGISNKDTMIALNINISKELSNDSHIKNIVMHEFGHRQYNLDEFDIVRFLNLKILGNLMPNIKNEADFKYFSDRNEIRLRIIPIIKEMYDNNWNSLETYNNSLNLKLDDIYTLYSKEEIIYWLNNIL